jgi:hypothetical protein
MGVTSTEAAACSFCLPTHLQAVLATSQRSVSAPAITLEPMPLALPLTRNRLRRAVRQGASWTAAYHLQLTVAAVARPVRGSVGAPGVLAAERSRLLLAQTASAPRSVQPVFERSGVVAMVDPASRHATASAAGVSSMRCPPIRFRCPGSGCPAVRCPVTWGRRPEVRRSAVCCPPILRPAVCCPPVRCPAVWCLPRPSGRVRLLPCSGGWRWDPGRGGRGDRDHRDGWRPRWLPSRRRLDRRSTRPGRGRRCRRRVDQWEVGGGPGPPGWVRAAAAALAR